MSRVVYLHVGAPKTGTTYLQDRLALNRTLLAEQGVHYPLGVYASQFRPALDLIDMGWGGQRDEVRGEWDSLVGRARRHQGQVVVSHEILAAATPDQVAKAMSDLDSEIHVVYSARDVARQIPAEWQEGLKHRRKLRFARFVRQVQNADRLKPSLWFWRVQSLPDVLTRWAHGLPPDHVHLVTVPPAGADPELLWHRYCRALSIDPAWAPDESERANVSIGIAESALLRRLNQRLKKTRLPSGDYRRLVRELTVHETLALRRDMTKVTLPPAAYPWAHEIAEEWVEWVVGSGIDVVGDVEDLHPGPPPDPGDWADPDRPVRGQMLDAALDALVAVLHEAATRPDPQEQLGAKISRAARRLRGQ